MTNGILYVATGDEFIRQATISAEYIDSVIDLPIAIITDHKIDADVFDEIIIDPDPTYSYIDKARNLHRSPFEKTLFIDSDVYILSNVGELFELLDDFEMAAAIDPNEAALRYRGLQYFEELPVSVPEYNTGVLAYQKSSSTFELCNTWVENFSKQHHTDQISFRRSLANTDIQFTSLSPLYNCLIDYPMQVTGEVKIIHDVSRTFLTEELELNADIEAHAKRINRDTGIRILHTTRESTTYPRTKRGDQITRALWMFNKVLLLLIEDGLTRTTKLVFRKIRRIILSS